MTRGKTDPTIDHIYLSFVGHAKHTSFTSFGPHMTLAVSHCSISLFTLFSRQINYRFQFIFGVNCPFNLAAHKHSKTTCKPRRMSMIQNIIIFLPGKRRTGPEHDTTTTLPHRQNTVPLLEYRVLSFSEHNLNQMILFWFHSNFFPAALWLLQGRVEHTLEACLMEMFDTYRGNL